MTDEIRKWTGEWMQTRYGRAWFFDEENFPTNHVNFREIARALAQINRFTGHTYAPVSVAQHSVLVMDLLPPELHLPGLLHDAHEAFLGDVSSPLKAHLKRTIPGFDKAWKDLEDRHDAAIYRAAGLAWPLSKSDKEDIKHADITAVMLERRDFLGKADALKWGDYEDVFLPRSPFYKRTAWSAKRAEKEFLLRFETLTGEYVTKRTPPCAAHDAQPGD